MGRRERGGDSGHRLRRRKGAFAPARAGARRGGRSLGQFARGHVPPGSVRVGVLRAGARGWLFLDRARAFGSTRVSLCVGLAAGSQLPRDPRPPGTWPPCPRRAPGEHVLCDRHAVPGRPRSPPLGSVGRARSGVRRVLIRASCRFSSSEFVRLEEKGPFSWAPRPALPSGEPGDKSPPPLRPPPLWGTRPVLPAVP